MKSNFGDGRRVFINWSFGLGFVDVGDITACNGDFPLMLSGN
jgi:hypothetical protein